MTGTGVLIFAALLSTLVFQMELQDQRKILNRRQNTKISFQSSLTMFQEYQQLSHAIGFPNH